MVLKEECFLSALEIQKLFQNYLNISIFKGKKYNNLTLTDKQSLEHAERLCFIIEKKYKVCIESEDILSLAQEIKKDASKIYVWLKNYFAKPINYEKFNLKVQLEPEYESTAYILSPTHFFLFTENEYEDEKCYFDYKNIIRVASLVKKEKNIHLFVIGEDIGFNKYYEFADIDGIKEGKIGNTHGYPFHELSRILTCMKEGKAVAPPYESIPVRFKDFVGIKFDPNAKKVSKLLSEDAKFQVNDIILSNGKVMRKNELIEI